MVEDLKIIIWYLFEMMGFGLDFYGNLLLDVL